MLAHVPFRTLESLSFGWEKTRKHSALLFQAMLVIFAIEILYSIVSSVLGTNTLQGFLALAALSILGAVIGVGFTIITLKIAQGKHTSFKDILPPWELFWKYAVVSVFVTLLVLAGLLLLIIPGIYLLLRFSMVRFLVLEGKGIMGSITHSSDLTEGVKWQLLWFFLAIIALNFIGALLFLVGLLVTVPVTMIAYAHVYEKIKGHKQ